MKELIGLIRIYRITCLWLLLVVVGGTIGGFVVAGALCMPLLLLPNNTLKIETFTVFFIVIFLLGDNFSGLFGFVQNLRFIILGIGLLILFRLKLFENNLALYILPFSIVATLVTYSLSPLGLEAVLRGISFYLMALVVFKFVELLMQQSISRFTHLLLMILGGFFLLNVFLFFLPLLPVTVIKGRYGGLMANPNGLGMAAMFSYAIIEVIHRKGQSLFSQRFFLLFKILLIGSVLLTASRTSLFGIFIFEISLRLLKHKLLLTLLLLITFYFYGISTAFSPQSIVESLGLSSYLRLDSIEDASGRTEVWVVAIEEIKNQPWLGKGMLYDSYFINNYADRFIGESRARHWYGIWNSYFSLLLNVGIVGVLAFSFFWCKMYALSQMKIVRFAFLMLCLFSAISESWMAASMNAFMPLVFLCWGLQIYHPKPKTNTE